MAVLLSLLVVGCGGGNKITKGDKQFSGTEAADGNVKVPSYPTKLPPDVQKKVDENKTGSGVGNPGKK